MSDYFACDNCNGTGEIDLYVRNEDGTLELISSKQRRNYAECPKCHGTGKLDWIEQIVGKKVSVMFYDVDTGNSTITLPAAPQEGHILSIESDPDTDGGIITIKVKRGAS